MKIKALVINKILILVLLLNLACTGSDTPKQTEIPKPEQSVKSTEPKQLSYKLIRSFFHDANSFTQGLFFADGKLYESTGLTGKSAIKIIDEQTGKVIKKEMTNPLHFGEGSVELNNKIYMLTWQNNTGYIFDLKLKKTGDFAYQGEGWGITSDGTNLIMSDGSSELKYINPDNFSVIKTIRVTDGEIPRSNLNELEYVNGFIYANVWQYDEIIKINPENGNVVGKLDLSDLRRMLPNPYGVDVLNGIAYNKKTDSYYVTGKNWQLMYEIKIFE